MPYAKSLSRVKDVYIYINVYFFFFFGLFAFSRATFHSIWKFPG